LRPAGLRNISDDEPPMEWTHSGPKLRPFRSVFV
jgi:hypothetical protein